MKNKQNKKLPLALKISLPIVLVLLICILGIVIYAKDYYRAENVEAAISESYTEGKYIVFDGGSDVGLIFYPGGKVEHTAYAPICAALADMGITTVLVEMPLNLAVLDAGAYKGAIELLPDINTWYIGGHSLGGAMAAGADQELFAGMILLAAYSSDEINIPTLTVYGTEDGVMNKEKYESGLSLLSQNTEIIIDGGNHAGFGSYGDQDGDNNATISKEEQLSITKIAILDFIKAAK